VPPWPLRPRLAIVVVLALGDYLLWDWSLSTNHDILALVFGMALIPLLIALAWLLVVALARLIAHTAQRSRARTGARERTVRSRPPTTGLDRRVQDAAPGEPASAGAPAGAPPSKLAA
jgi:uncharacterized membrane protein